MERFIENAMYASRWLLAPIYFGLSLALLALAGDLGCSGGPTLVGAVASAASDNLKIGILVAIIFPVVMALGVCLCKKKKYPGLV